MSNPKQIIVMRKDLNMRKGKMVAQGAHASMAVIFEKFEEIRLMNNDTTAYCFHVKKVFREWLATGHTKICVSVNSEQELLDLHNAAKAAGIMSSLIKDAGHTEFNEPTYTAVAIGPDYPDSIDPLTKHLPLL